MKGIWSTIGLSLLFAHTWSQYMDLNCDAPASKTYTCAVDSDFQPVFAACSSQIRDLYGGLPLSSNCAPYVGSSLNIVCTNQSLVLYKNNVSLGNLPVTYNYVTESNNGLYECRLVNENSETEVLYSRIVAINNRTTVGLECHDIYIVHKENFICCGADYQHFPLSVNVYCDGVCNVSVGVQWFDHIAVDLDFPQTTQIQQNTVYKLTMGPKAKVPYVVLSNDPYVYVVNVLIWVHVRASNGATRDVCFPYKFDNTNGLYAKLIVSEDAIFQCEYSYELNSLPPAYIEVDLHLTNGTYYTAVCNSSSCIGNMTLNIAPSTVNPENVYISTLTLSSLTNDYNNSQYTCSLWFSDVVQWRNTTTLIIPPTMPSSVLLQPLLSIQSMYSCSSYCKGLVGGLISGGALIGAIIAVVYIKRQCKHAFCNTASLQNDTNLYISSHSTKNPKPAVCSECKFQKEIEVNQVTPPCMSIVVNASEHLDRRWRSSSLSEVKCNYRKSRIYLSYSEDVWSWVSGYLKPLIQKLILGSEVTVHNDDMVAGHPISEERMRLILEADKVLIVCSPGYEHSPWCQYELLQSVSKDPGLMDGRIISILCDSCNTVPPIIRGVVSLRDDDPMFECKLQQCLNYYKASAVVSKKFQ